VEQDSEQRVKDHLPNWVRYIHTPLPDHNMPYSRAWAFNIAANAARSECLIFHDNDMLVPETYARHILKYHQQGYDFINLKRFIFYLTNTHTQSILESSRLLCDYAPEAVVQNLEAGGSFGADKKAFWGIGGFDERFIGWGGEDNEFWERALTRKVYLFGFLPLIHLWHEPQIGKTLGDKVPTKHLFKELMKQDPLHRIQQLKSNYSNTFSSCS
jgi:predicted glycosyltransferase involved in capsule biosynthesis